MAESKPRLTRETWLEAGLAALEATGPEALKAEPLARELGTTKGSFYWHFKDVPAFQLHLLQLWRDRALGRLVPLPGASPTERLLHLARPDGAEAAIRAMAQKSLPAADVLRDVDAARRTALAGELSALGLSNPDFAALLQATVIGLEALGDTSPLSTLLAALLALQEA